MSVLTKPDEPRIFLAARVSTDVIAAASEYRDRLAPHLPGARWTHQDDLHVTLKFFGATSHERIAELSPIAGATSAATVPFHVAFEGVDVFTPRRKPQILWGKVREGHEALVAFVARLDVALEKAGFAKEARPYQPHLTLARLSAETLRLGSEVVTQTSFTTPSFQVDAITLFASDLSAPPHAARYRALQLFSFRGTSLADCQEGQTQGG